MMYALTLATLSLTGLAADEKVLEGGLGLNHALLALPADLRLGRADLAGLDKLPTASLLAGELPANLPGVKLSLADKGLKAHHVLALPRDRHLGLVDLGGTKKSLACGLLSDQRLPGNLPLDNLSLSLAA